MKKALSILFASLILLSGLHVSMASHYCGGELAAVKWSLSDVKANCGMEMSVPSCPSDHNISQESCCKDKITYFVVDSNYNLSSLEVNNPELRLLQVFYIPQNTVNSAFSSTLAYNSIVRPPGKFLPNAVSQSFICVFVI